MKVDLPEEWLPRRTRGVRHLVVILLERSLPRCIEGASVLRCKLRHDQHLCMSSELSSVLSARVVVLVLVLELALVCAMLAPVRGSTCRAAPSAWQHRARRELRRRPARSIFSRAMGWIDALVHDIPYRVLRTIII